MTEATYQALVVEDEPAVQSLTVRALTREGFQCDTAKNGEEGKQMIDTHRYDVVVTDLRMPKMHGHALCLDVLKRHDHPLLVVLTGVLEPKLARDLIARGVDEITFKPVDYSLFATKIRATLARRMATMSADNGCQNATNPPAAVSPANSNRAPIDKGLMPVRSEDLTRKLANVSTILPISQAALDVFALANSTSTDAQELAAAVSRDASLVTDVLQLANCSVYNPSGKRVIELEEAVARIGQNRIRELALATSALTTVTAGMLPWMDVHLAWQRSVAAGVAVELLIAEGHHERIEDGMALGAIMHPLGRIVLGTLYPRKYEAMLDTCQHRGIPLLGQEVRVFSTSHARIMGRLLSTWNIPSEVYLPLSHALDSYEDVDRLHEPLKTQVLVVKLAILMGSLAINRWEPWDLIELPPELVLDALGIDSWTNIIRQTKEDLQGILSFREQSHRSKPSATLQNSQSDRNVDVAYCNLSSGPCDLLPAILQGMGVRTSQVALDDCRGDQRVVVNCRGRSPQEDDMLTPLRAGRHVLIVCDANTLNAYQQIGRAVAIPGSYGTLQSACEESFFKDLALP